MQQVEIPFHNPAWGRMTMPQRGQLSGEYHLSTNNVLHQRALALGRPALMSSFIMLIVNSLNYDVSSFSLRQ